MTEYVNPLYPTQQPTNTTFTSIDFDTFAQLLWNTQNITNSTQYYLATNTNLNPSNNATVQLPKPGLSSLGSQFFLVNQSSYTISIIASDGTNITTIAAGKKYQFILQATTTTTNESVCWQFFEFGVTSNTNNLSQNLGASLRYINSTNDVQVAQTVTAIQVALPLSGTVYTLTQDQAIAYSNTILYNPRSVTNQVNVLLDSSAALYGACGFACTFVNEANVPIVLQTQGDTINGVPLQSTTYSASFVVVPGASVCISSTPGADWVIVSQSQQYQNVFKTASLNLSTATYVYLSANAATTSSIVTILPNSTGAVTVAIDLSSNFDFFYSPLWVITGALPPSIVSFMQSRGQTSFWILLPNNLSYVYFIQAQSTSTTYKFGLGARFGSVSQVALPANTNTYAAGQGYTWAWQYSAQINTASPQLSTQFISGLLIAAAGGGGGTQYPDITDINGLVSITGSGGLYVPNGPTAMIQGSNIGGELLAVVVPNPTAGDIVVTNADGETRDSGKTFSNDANMGGNDPSPDLIPTQEAVNRYVEDQIAQIIDFRGDWNAATNTPDLTNPIYKVNGHAYIVSVAGTQDLNGTGPVLYEVGHFVVYDGPDDEWVEVEQAIVLSVNGEVGNVVLELADIDDVTITGPQQGEALIYDAGTGTWVNDFAQLPGITADGYHVDITDPFTCTNAATFESTALFEGQVTFGVGSSTNPPLFVGDYGLTPDPRSLVTLEKLSQQTVYPNISDTGGIITFGNSGYLGLQNNGYINTTGLLTTQAGITNTGTVTLNGLSANSPLQLNGSNQVTAAAINLSSQVTGNLPVTNLNGGSGASSSTFWRGDGTWAPASGGGTQATLTNYASSSGLNFTGVNDRNGRTVTLFFDTTNAVTGINTFTFSPQGVASAMGFGTINFLSARTLGQAGWVGTWSYTQNVTISANLTTVTTSSVVLMISQPSNVSAKFGASVVLTY